MTAMSIREGRRPRSFLCRDDLYDAFEARATELSCSVDWLLAEAMKRLLADRGLAPPPPPPPPLPSRRPPLPPPPPPRRRPTGSFVGAKAQVLEGIALRCGDQRVIVDRDRFVIGRSARDAQLPIRDGNVSRQHAILERGPDGWAVVDMASTNGVLLNGTRVTRAAIRVGDVIGIGPFSIRVERA
jgi:pSer/pThr/pTyr-binding forkhead associated (FHA) protein